MKETWRKTTQKLAPVRRPISAPGIYDLYPAHPLPSRKIASGFNALAQELSSASVVIIDGYVGVFWSHLRRFLHQALTSAGLRPHWIDVSTALRSPAAIQSLVDPFLGGDDPLFGTRYTGTLVDFFDRARLDALRPHDNADLTIIYGCGAALAGWDGLLIYVDLPKNEIQYRSRAGAVCNLGAAQPGPPREMYKRFYFVDWIALNRHKKELLPAIDLIVDQQRPHEPLSMSGTTLRDALAEISCTAFRVRPWFEPGPWGGQWMREEIPHLPQEVPNYAWSFELIAPENGLMFESDGLLLEVSFDFLMFAQHRKVLGGYAAQFQYEFPIRFDYLDTIDGGNLSLQCHPRADFMRRHFGESFTQNETYYIMECRPDARVYLGFREDIDPLTFHAELERSLRDNSPVDVERFVNTETAHKHDLFLIPSGTIHCSGAGNLVLEISATPYIFTFKLYDWLRLDLGGQPRPLNIERAFQNLDFERQGQRVLHQLVSRPSLLEQGAGWQVVHLPTHPEHFYDVHRLEFDSAVEVATEGSPHILNLVEGSSLILEVGDSRRRFNFAETFVVPAAAGRYRLINEASRRARVVKAFLKGDYDYR